MSDLPMTPRDAAENGSRLDLLIALRRRLVDALEDPRTQPRDLSPIVLRLREIAVEIEAMAAEESDEIADAINIPDGAFNVADI